MKPLRTGHRLHNKLKNQIIKIKNKGVGMLTNLNKVEWMDKIRVE